MTLCVVSDRLTTNFGVVKSVTQAAEERGGLDTPIIKNQNQVNCHK